MKRLAPFLLMYLLTLVLCRPVWAATVNDEPAWMDRLRQGFSCRLRVVGYGMWTGVADRDRNPGNRIMHLPDQTAALQLRPDLRLDTDRLSLLLQPRAELYRESRGRGPEAGEDEWRDDTFVHQWLVRWRCTDTLYVSYGRENLQWGPAYLTALSNPFFEDNGKSNPEIEVDTTDFARAVWVPGPSWSFSLIANTSRGRQEPVDRDFTRTYALKVDYTGSADYGGVILTRRENTFNEISGFYGRTVSDALLVYAEGALQNGTSAQYPLETDSPLGVSLSERKRSDTTWIGSVLAGASYTFESGPTLTLEYLHDGPGDDGEEAGAFYDLQARAADAIRDMTPLASLGYQALGATADPGLRFLRQNYLMLQYVQTDIADTIDLTLRCTRNLDDGSRRISFIGGWFVGDHLKLFAVGTLDNGSRRSEFGDIIDYQAMFGMMLIF